MFDGGASAWTRPRLAARARRSESRRLLDVLVDELRHLEHRDLALAAEDRLQVVVGVDHAALLLVLEPLPLDVLPELLRDLRAGHLAAADDRGERGIGLHRPHERGVRRALRAGLLRGPLLRRALPLR